ncbi:hypothetical protein ACWDUL_31470 [Nocardia niigatensis]
MTTKGVLLSATACAVLLIAGCGGSDGSSKSDNAPSTPRDQLVLVESEFPAGAKKMDIPQDKLQTSLAGTTGSLANATVTPEDCRGPKVDLAAAANDMLAKSTFSVASTPDLTNYVDYVSGTAMDLSKMADNYAKCPEVKVTTTGSGDPVDTTTKFEKLTVPGALAGTGALAYRSSSSSSVAGSGFPISQTTYEGYATLRGVTVGVRATSLGSAVPDQAVFDKFFTAAVQKVQNAK